MMRDLQHINVLQCPRRDQFAFHLSLHVTGQQEAMFALAPLGTETSDPAGANVTAYEEMLGVRFPQAAADILLTALQSMPASE